MVDGVSTILDIYIKEFGDAKTDRAETIAKIDKFRREVLYEMWKQREFTKASCTICDGRSSNTVPEMSHRRTHEKWYLGKRIKEDKEVCDLWQRICAKPFKETQDLQQRMLERIREIECNEKMGENRTQRLRALGNSIVPQIVYVIGTYILMIEDGCG